MIITTRNKSATFNALCWITGAANFTDPDPNVTPPNANRIISPPGYILLTPATQAACAIAVATSATVRLWWYDDAHILWIPANAGQALTYTGSNTAVATVGGMVGSKWFAQFTANVGVTTAAFFFR